MDWNSIDLTNPEQRRKAKFAINKLDRDELIKALKHDITIPLPEELEKRHAAVLARIKTFEQVEALSDLIEAEAKRRDPVLLKAPSLLEVEAYLPEFLIDNWMPANRLTLLTGQGGIGKSYLALQHIAALALGIEGYALKTYHGKLEELYEKDQRIFRKNPIDIVIASYEEGLMETWARLARCCEWLGWGDYEALKRRVHFVDLKMFGPLWGVEQDTHLATRAKLLGIGEWLMDRCKNTDARLLMLDPSAGVYGGSENARESVREFCSHLNGWGQEIGCATLLIAHPNKAGDDYSGNTDWLGSCRAMWTLRIEQENKGTKTTPKWHHWYQLTNLKQNYASPQRAVYLRKIKKANGKWTPIWEECSQEDAEAFYKQYKEGQSSTSTTQENAHDEADDLEELIANS